MNGHVVPDQINTGRGVLTAVHHVVAGQHPGGGELEYEVEVFGGRTTGLPPRAP
jgi:hypothetical protein